MTFVLDSSVTLSWVFEDETIRGEAANSSSGSSPDSVLTRLLGDEAVVPTLWPLEVANALLVGQRRGRLTHSEIQRFLQLLAALPIEIDPETPRVSFHQILPLAREQNLSAYDASYLELALRIGSPLATRDADLIRAASATGESLA